MYARTCSFLVLLLIRDVNYKRAVEYKNTGPRSNYPTTTLRGGSLITNQIGTDGENRTRNLLCERSQIWGKISLNINYFNIF